MSWKYSFEGRRRALRRSPLQRRVGERVVVTKHGCPFVELVAVRPVSGMDFAKAAEVRRAMGLDGVTIKMPDHFDDPAFSREVLGLED